MLEGKETCKESHKTYARLQDKARDILWKAIKHIMKQEKQRV